ncbi:hypothetical protein [Nostoc sp.]|uniref:hypothetical protein n=1 Tax=Nostoc sp. TaxID=1180 RepID=UPI002FFA1E58
MYPTNFTVLDEMLEPVRWAGSPACSNWRAYSHYRTNPEVICINQDVPTYFYAVQRSRLPIIGMLLDRGLSDTNRVKLTKSILSKYFARFLHVFLPLYETLPRTPNGIGRKTVVNSLAVHLITSLRVGERLLAGQAKIFPLKIKKKLSQYISVYAFEGK